MSAGRFARQSFLGADAEERIARVTIGVPGLGGGGSHIVQQLAHIGFQRYVLYDDDVVEESNLNRLVGGEVRDAIAETPKLHIAKMKILGLQPNAIIRGYACKWQGETRAAARMSDRHGRRRRLPRSARTRNRLPPVPDALH